MKSRNIGERCVVATAALGLAMIAQAAAAPQERTASEQQVTVTGCIQSEADYRRARDAGRGGIAGTGAGVGNEFVLINASMAKSGAGAAAETPTGTAGAATMAYELTGTGEGKAAAHVGKRVEIAGTLKAAEVQAGRPTGGATAGKPPEGVDVAGKDLKLRELEVTSIREVPGTCPKG